MINGRIKGSSFERKIAKIFQKWTGYEFRRTPQSGGWSHNNADTSGDLICMEKGIDFPLHIECKNTESWNLQAILSNNCQPFYDWYKQVDKACPANKKPIIIFSKAYSPEYVTFYKHDFFHAYKIIQLTGTNHIYLKHEADNGRIIILLSDFLEHFTYKGFVRHLVSE